MASRFYVSLIYYVFYGKKISRRVVHESAQLQERRGGTGCIRWTRCLQTRKRLTAKAGQVHTHSEHLVDTPHWLASYLGLLLASAGLSWALPPTWQLAITGLLIQQKIELSIIAQCQLRNEDPYQQVTLGHVEVVKEIVLDSSPASTIVSFVSKDFDIRIDLLAL
jgi:hypothetical protein